MYSASWDVVVVGLGAVGSAAVYQLARRGRKVLGFDRFHPPHNHGSSHGETRITRLSVGEGAEYVPLVRRSHEIWRELEESTGRSLLRQVGGLYFGPGEHRTETHGAADFLGTTIRVAREHGIRHELLDAPALAARFPQFRYRGDEIGYFEPDSGYVRPEECVAAHLDEAERLGARVSFGERLERWDPSAGGVSLRTDRGIHQADRVILCAGAWMPQVAAGLRSRLKVFRQVQGWFEPEGPAELFAPGRLPVFIRVPGPDEVMFYGFPAIGGPGSGVKVASEQFHEPGMADEIGPDVGPGETAKLQASVSPHLRITPLCLRSVACKYTVTPDSRFVLDRHPGLDQVYCASACSGHGFKHSAAIGEALAEWVVEGRTRFDLSRFRWE